MRARRFEDSIIGRIGVFSSAAVLVTARLCAAGAGLSPTPALAPADCRSSGLVLGECRRVEGALYSHDGWPPRLRIEVARSRRVLGVGPIGSEILPHPLAALLPARVAGEFEVCPLGDVVRLPYHRPEDSGIEMVCVQRIGAGTVTRWDFSEHVEKGFPFPEPDLSMTASAVPEETDLPNTRASSMREEKILQLTARIESGAVGGEHLAGAYYERSDLYEKIGRPDLAIPDAEKALELGIDDARYSLGVYLSLVGESDRATEALTAVIDDPEAHRARSAAHRARGWVRFYRGDYAGARGDFEAALAGKPASGLDYPMLWVLLAIRRGDATSADELDRRLQGVDLGNWPGPLWSLLRGRLQPSDVLERIRNEPNERLDREQSCEAFFFIGQVHLLRGEVDKAREAFARTLSTGVKSFNEYTSAKIELERLAAP